MKSLGSKSKRLANKTITKEDLKSVDLYSINSFVLLQEMQIKTDLTRSYEFSCLPKDADSDSIKINFSTMENSSIVIKDVEDKEKQIPKMQYLYFGKAN